MADEPLGVLQAAANFDHVAGDAPAELLDVPHMRAKEARLPPGQRRRIAHERC
jgi:hypothetical protein